LAERGHYPAIDLLRSISRLMNQLTTPAEQQSAQIVRRLLAVLHENEDLLSIGAYRKGANRDLDVAVAMKDQINALLQQKVDERLSFAETRQALTQLGNQCEVQLQANGPLTANATSAGA